MSAPTIAPAFRVTTVRSLLQGACGHYIPESLPEFALYGLLARLAEVMAPGKPAPTKNALAELVEQAATAAREAAWAAREAAWAEACACGHGWPEHVGRGCLECDECRERRPQREIAWTPQVLPTPAEVAKAYDDAYRHFPSGGRP